MFFYFTHPLHEVSIFNVLHTEIEIVDTFTVRSEISIETINFLGKFCSDAVNFPIELIESIGNFLFEMSDVVYYIVQCDAPGISGSFHEAIVRRQ